jgi:hypothetical protein
MTVKLPAGPDRTGIVPGDAPRNPVPSDLWCSPQAVGTPLPAAIQDLGHGGTATFAPAGLADPGPAAAPALEAFRRLAELWRLSLHDQLTLLGLRDTQKATYYRWLRDPDLRLDRDPMDRIGHVLAIFEALGHLFQEPAQADAWVRQPNRHPLFQGRPPLARLLAGAMADLIAVRAHLEAARDGLA